MYLCVYICICMYIYICYICRAGAERGLDQLNMIQQVGELLTLRTDIYNTCRSVKCRSGCA